MQIGDLVGSAFSLIFYGVIAYAIWSVVRQVRGGRAARERNEAMFRSMFPDLQPWFHPRKLIAYVLARRVQAPTKSGRAWKKPPGFETDVAEIRFVDGREQVRLLDAAGAVLAQFVFEEHAEGGVLRFGKGKFTVNTQDRNNPRVRYWHPDREFKWKRNQWTFQSRVAEREMETSDSGTSFASDSSSSTSSVARGAAVAGGVAAAGGMAAAAGAFDGGGASAAWDGQADGASSGPVY